MSYVVCVFFFQAEDGIRYLVRSRGLGDVYKRQVQVRAVGVGRVAVARPRSGASGRHVFYLHGGAYTCLLYTSDAADERSSVDLGGRRIIKKKTKDEQAGSS